jgi:hypothetical protein
MKNIAIVSLLAIGIICSSASVATASAIDPTLAKQYFNELKRISDSDNGHLWDVPLYGPTMFVDQESRQVVANQPDHNGRLKAAEGVYVGTLDQTTNISNTSVEWSGTKWTMVSWDALSPTDQYDRARLLVHESWHRIQNRIGIPAVLSDNTYLDHTDGRIDLILEFRALAAALAAKDESAQTEAIGDALTLRDYRQFKFPDNNENAFEKNEGIAEYTGLKLCGLPDSLLCRIAGKKLQLGENNDGLTNSFAYLTGPAYGFLLDRYESDWRSKVCKGADLSTLLGTAINRQAPQGKDQLTEAAERISRKYNVDELTDKIAASEQSQQHVIETFRNRLQSGGRLIIPNDNLSFSYDPNEPLVPYDTIGVIYTTLRLSGDFGVLEATEGILRTNDWQVYIATAPDYTNGNPIIWPGYELQLNPGWQVVAKGPGIFVIEK